MLTFTELTLTKYLNDLHSVLSECGREEPEYDVLREEHDRVVSALDAGEGYTDITKTKVINTRTPRTSAYASSPRVTKVYFTCGSPEQAKGYGLTHDGGDTYYMNTWKQKLSVIELDTFVKTKGIPFPMSKFKVYGGRKAK